MKIATYEIDVAHDFPLIELVKTLDQFDLEILHYTRNGPAGGNQFIKVSGEPVQFEAWYVINYGPMDQAQSHKVSR